MKIKNFDDFMEVIFLIIAIAGLLGLFGFIALKLAWT